MKISGKITIRENAALMLARTSMHTKGLQCNVAASNLHFWGNFEVSEKDSTVAILSWFIDAVNTFGARRANCTIECFPALEIRYNGKDFVFSEVPDFSDPKYFCDTRMTEVDLINCHYLPESPTTFYSPRQNNEVSSRQWEKNKTLNKKNLRKKKLILIALADFDADFETEDEGEV